jgi:uncharacterized protein
VPGASVGVRPSIHVLSGGPYHPVAAQFAVLQEALSDRAEISCYPGASAFDQLDACDLFVLAGMHWTDCAPDRHVWPEGVEPCSYTAPTDAQKQAFVEYVSSGRPVLGWHGGVASFDDWPEFGRLIGFRWDWRVTTHTAYANWAITVEPTGHPVIAGVGDFALDDELYCNVQITPGLDFVVHAWARYHEIRLPMIVTAEGGRIAGAGRTAFLANGHDLKTMACESYRRVAVNTLRWLLTI